MSLAGDDHKFSGSEQKFCPNFNFRYSDVFISVHIHILPKRRNFCLQAVTPRTAGSSKFANTKIKFSSKRHGNILILSKLLSRRLHVAWYGISEDTHHPNSDKGRAVWNAFLPPHLSCATSLHFTGSLYRCGLCLPTRVNRCCRIAH